MNQIYSCIRSRRVWLPLKPLKPKIKIKNSKSHAIHMQTCWMWDVRLSARHCHCTMPLGSTIFASSTRMHQDLVCIQSQFTSFGFHKHFAVQRCLLFALHFADDERVATKESENCRSWLSLSVSDVYASLLQSTYAARSHWNPKWFISALTAERAREFRNAQENTRVSRMQPHRQALAAIHRLEYRHSVKLTAKCGSCCFW